MNGLGRSFSPPEEYTAAGGYRLLPLRFLSLDEARYVVTGLAGDYAVLERSDLRALVGHELCPGSKLYEDLKGKHLIADGDSQVYRDLLAAKYRTKQARLPAWTALHMFVVTLRCDHTCQYCQVSRVSEDRASFDMTPAVADRAIDLMLQSPSPTLKVEFQGGESLLNFELVKYVVNEVERRIGARQVAFVITTNLANLTDEMIDFAGHHGILFSTSLDGPAALHNANRPRPGRDSHARVIESIERIRARLGPDAVAALMTSTAESLRQPEAIIDEYVARGFRSIFLRYISPYGFAVKTRSRIGYETEEFIEFFKRGLKYIIRLNLEGTPLRVTYTQLLLERILSPYPTGYVDLQSPAGMGIAGIVYNYDGGVYAADEGRMLAEMGDQTFRLGHVDDTYEKLFLESPLLPMVHETMTEGLPGCVDCAFQPYCGSDPIFHHRTQGDPVGHRPTSAFCKRNMSLMRHIIQLLEDDPKSARVLKSWL